MKDLHIEVSSTMPDGEMLVIPAQEWNETDEDWKKRWVLVKNIGQPQNFSSRKGG